MCAKYLTILENVAYTIRPTNAVRQLQRTGEMLNKLDPIPARLAALKSMSVTQLKSEWQTIFATAAPNNSRAFLESRLAYRIQELTYGGPDRETRRMLDLLADEVSGTLTRKSQIADPRNPVVGTRLIREWNGVDHTITVLRDGFEWQGRPYKSLSAIARVITGTRWNGYRFFGLRERKRGND